MKRIKIIKHGVFRKDGPLPIGTELEVPSDFTAWPGKWIEIQTPTGEKTLTVATPSPPPGISLDSASKAELQAELERVTGSPAPRWANMETLRKMISEAGTNVSTASE